MAYKEQFEPYEPTTQGIHPTAAFQEPPCTKGTKPQKSNIFSCLQTGSQCQKTTVALAAAKEISDVEDEAERHKSTTEGARRFEIQQLKRQQDENRLVKKALSNIHMNT